MKAEILQENIVLIPENEDENMQLCNILANYKISGDMELYPEYLSIPVKKINHHEK